MSVKPWKCNNCNLYFLPNKPDYKCPKCRFPNTSPAKDYDPIKHELWQSHLATEKICPKCSTSMLPGFLVERNSPLQGLTLGEGVYWSHDETGVIGSRIALVAYACQECGLVESYIRRMSAIKKMVKTE